jgi:hypothetical protein
MLFLPQTLKPVWLPLKEQEFLLFSALALLQLWLRLCLPGMRLALMPM